MARFRSLMLVMALIMFLAACGGGGSTILPPADNGGDRTGNQGTDENPPADDGSDLQILFVSATPQTGPAPLKVDFLAVVRGGVAPYKFQWDFTNDGAPDVIQNNVKVTTGTTSFTYPFLETDRAKGLNQSTFGCTLTVTDSRVKVVRTLRRKRFFQTSGSSFMRPPPP